MPMVVDCHSHILPGIDDGSATVEESLALLRMEAEQGVRHVLATPHFYARYDAPERFLEKRTQAEVALRKAMAGCPDLPELTVGAEVYFFRGMSESDFLQELTIGAGNCLLVEMPHGPWKEDACRELAAIWEKRGILPIVAHIDRYIRPFRTHGIPKLLERLPVLVQANADFFLERPTAGMAMRMLKAGQIQLLGSDCHNTKDRKPNLEAVVQLIERKLGKDALNVISEYERRVLGL